MKASLNDEALKTKFIEQLQAHRAADQIAQGSYGEEVDGKWHGCAVACSLRSLDIIDGKKSSKYYSTHHDYEDRLGIPVTIAHLEDKIFEGLPAEKAKDWPVRFGTAIPVGADLSLVTPRFMMWLLTDMKQYAPDAPDVLKSIDQVIGLYERVIAGGTVTDNEWNAAEGAAAWAAAGAAGAAAWATEGATEGAAYERMADKLIELLETAPVSN